MPYTLCSEHGWKSRPISPVFFAPTDIQPGELNAELKSRLLRSKNLIVICSPRSARSQWVGQEIEYFASLGRKDSIHLFIVGGFPHSGNPDTVCFNPAIERAGLGDVLGANIHEKVSRWAWINRKRAYVQLITKLLGIEIDSLWQRHKRLLCQRVAAWTTLAVALARAFASTFVFTLPFDADIRLADGSGAKLLPTLQEAIISIRETEKEGGEKMRTDTLLSGELLTFKDIPHSLLGKEVRISISAPEFIPSNIILHLDSGIRISLMRDPAIYGDVHFKLLSPDGSPAAGRKLVIAGQTAVSSTDGYVTMRIPFAMQAPYYVISSPNPLEQDTLYMPLSTYTVVMEKLRE